MASERPETGPMKFGEDWTGVFLRGDNALMGYLPALDWAVRTLEALCETGAGTFQHAVHVGHLKHLAELMTKAHEGTSPDVQHIGKWEDVRRTVL